MEAAPTAPVLTLQPKQSLAFTTRATEVLFGGAAGAGKSHLLRVVAIAWCCMIPGLKVGLFRRLYPDLKANHLEGPGSFYVLLAGYIASGHVRIIHGEIIFWNGSRINLHHCQRETDVIKYQGAEFHVLLFDELTHFTQYQYRYIRGRLRTSKDLIIPPHLRKCFPRIMSGSNPGGIGHAWVKETFVEPGEMRIHRASKAEGGMKRQYIPGRLHDNPALLLSDPEYIDRLSGLGDPVLVRALMDGDWDVAAGAMFGDVWRKDRHTCDSFPIPVDWNIWMGADDGYAAPASVHWLTQDPVNKTIYVIAELTEAKMLPETMAAKIKRISAAILRRHNQHRVEPHGPEGFSGLLDSAAFADTGTGGIPRGNQLKALGIRFKPVEKWVGSPIHRAQNLARLLGPNPNDPEGRPGIIFFKTCPSAIKTIPTLPRDKNNIEQADTNGDDHDYDSVTYGVQYKIGRKGSMRAGT